MEIHIKKGLDALQTETVLRLLPLPVTSLSSDLLVHHFRLQDLT